MGDLDNVICVAKLISDHGIVKDMKPKTGIGTNVHLTHGTEYPCCILKKVCTSETILVGQVTGKLFSGGRTAMRGRSVPSSRRSSMQ